MCEYMSNFAASACLAVTASGEFLPDRSGSHPPRNDHAKHAPRTSDLATISRITETDGICETSQNNSNGTSSFTAAMDSTASRVLGSTRAARPPPCAHGRFFKNSAATACAAARSARLNTTKKIAKSLRPAKIHQGRKARNRAPQARPHACDPCTGSYPRDLHRISPGTRACDRYRPLPP